MCVKKDLHNDTKRHKACPVLGCKSVTNWQVSFVKKTCFAKHLNPSTTVSRTCSNYSPALISKIIASVHNTAMAGHLGTHRSIEKIQERLYWPGFKEDFKKDIRCCYRCQKEDGLPMTHRHSLVDWRVSYFFHHIFLEFIGPLPISNNCQYLLLIGELGIKWYELIPLAHQRAGTTANALLSHRIFRFGCPHSIRTVLG